MAKSKTRGWMPLAAAVLCFLGAGLVVGCSASKLQKQIDAQTTAAATADTSQAAAAAKAQKLSDAMATATQAATKPDGTIDKPTFYDALSKQLADPAKVDPVTAAAISGAVASGTPPDQAALTMVQQALADAVKFKAAADAARAQIATLQAQVPAAQAKDDQTWGAGTTIAQGVATIFGGPGLGAIIGAGLAGGVLLIRQKKVNATTLAQAGAAAATAYANGQTDGATQVAQGVATLRKAVPAVDAALNSVAPLLKKVVADTMDPNVAAAVTANRDTPADDLHSVLASIGPATTTPPTAVAA